MPRWIRGGFENPTLRRKVWRSLVLKSMGALADKSDSRSADCTGWGAPRYCSVEDEHDIDVVEDHIGSAFVLAQTSTTQAVSILKRIYEDAGVQPGYRRKKPSC